MKIEINVPTSINEITLGQYQVYESKIFDDIDLDEVRKILISSFTDIDYDDVDKLKQSDKEEISDKLYNIVKEEGEFVNRFYLGGIEHGLIPNMDKGALIGDEYTDLIKYPLNNTSTLHRLMAVIYRPIKEEDRKGNYTVVPYMGTSEWGEKMKEVPFSIVNGMQGFFLTVSKILEQRTQKYSEEQEKEAV